MNAPWRHSLLTLAPAVLLLSFGGPALTAQEEPVEESRSAEPAPPSDAAPAPEAPSLEPVPEPLLDGLEDEVAEQLVSTREQLARYFSHPEADAAVRAESYGELGRLYHAYGLSDPALAAYRNAHALAPEDYRWAYLLASLSQQEGELEAAEDLYARALGIQETAPALIHLAEVYIEQGRLEEAEALLRRVLSGAPQSPSARALLGQVALARDEHALAVEYLEAALEAVPRANRLHYPLALAYRGLGEMEKAEEHLAQRGEVGVRPPDPLREELEELKTGERVHVLRGRTAFRVGDYQAAARQFRRAVDARPESIPARVNLGSALGQLGDRIGAIHQFRRVLELDADNVASHFNLGVLLGLEGKTQEALGHLERAVELDPGDGEAWRELAQILEQTGRPEEALEAYRRAAGILPYDPDTRLGEVQLLVNLGRLEEAGQRLEDTHGVLPRSPRVVNAYARFLAAAPDPSLRDGERALEVAEQLVEIQPTAAHAQSLALALAEVGRCDEAAEWQQRVVDAHRQAGETTGLPGLEATLARYQAGAPCRPPSAAAEADDP